MRNHDTLLIRGRIEPKTVPVQSLGGAESLPGIEGPCRTGEAGTVG